jgi:[ribosomal protein S5]-alanine N-acetyltransferase
LNPSIFLESERLILREMNSDDAQEAFHLNQDPHVFLFTGDSPFEDIEAAKNFLLNYNAYRIHGVGRWAVLIKETNQFAGWCGLKFHPAINQYDLGFRIHTQYRGQGIATEASKACLKWGFSNLRVQHFFAHVHPENSPSKRVLEKLGFNFIEEIEEEGRLWLHYELHRNEFEI